METHPLIYVAKFSHSMLIVLNFTFVTSY